MAVEVAGSGASVGPSVSDGARTPRRQQPLPRAWLLAAVAHVACFGALALLYTQAPADFPQPPFWSPRAGHSADVAALQRTALGLPRVALTATQFAVAHQVLLAGTLVSAILLLARTAKVAPPGAIWAAGLVLAAIAVLMPPLYSTDVFYYGVTGELVARAGADPYATAPSALVGSALLPFNYWDIPSPYGPVWTTASALVVQLGAFDPWRVVLLFKLLGAASVLGTAWLLGRHLGPASAPVPLALVLLNPVVWLEAVANAHLDALMLLLVAAAVVPLATGRPRLAWGCLVLAMWVKYTIAPVLALHVVARIRRQGGGPGALCRALGTLGVDAAALTVLVWLPYWRGPATLASLVEESGRSFSGPLAQVVLGVTLRLGVPDSARQAVLGQALALGALGLLALCLCAALWLWRRPGGPTPDDELRAWATVLVALPFAVPSSHVWYLLVPLGLLPFAWRRAPRLVLAAHAVAAGWLFLRYAPA